MENRELEIALHCDFEESENRNASCEKHNKPIQKNNPLKKPKKKSKFSKIVNHRKRVMKTLCKFLQKWNTKVKFGTMAHFGHEK